MDKILMVEDDAAIASGLSYALMQEGFEVVCAGDLKTARKLLGLEHDAQQKLMAYNGEQTAAAHSDMPALILLDVLLPDGSGFDLCREVKGRWDIPMIFLTACDDEVNAVMGLDMGGDDYITKPFRLRELISRVRSVLRRLKRSGENKEILTVGDICVYTSDAKVLKNGSQIFLTALEYRLLLMMISHRGQILSRNQLLESLWDISGDFVNDNTLTVYMKRLREKLEDDPQKPEHLQTVRGLGYKLI